MPHPSRSSRKPPPAAALLKAWLGEQGRTQEWLAGALGISASAVWHWMDGSSGPVLETAAVLERLTCGSVQASAWADPRAVSRRVSHANAHW